MQGMINKLKTWGDNDLRKPIWLPSASKLWLRTDLVPTNFLNEVLNFNLWMVYEERPENFPKKNGKKKIKWECFYQFNGTNSQQDLETSHWNWKNTYFSSKKNVLYRNKHYFQAPIYSSDYLSSLYDLAIDNLVKNIVNYLWPID